MSEYEKLKQELNYDKDSGLFTWIKRNHSFGKTAGALQKDGYIRIKFNGKLVMAHRLAWFYVYGVWPTHQIDHINRIKSDNKISNLRDIPQHFNCLNLSNRRINQTGHIGIYKYVQRNKYLYVARYFFEKRNVYVGTYSNLEEALAARNIAISKIDGYFEYRPYAPSPLP